MVLIILAIINFILGIIWSVFALLEKENDTVKLAYGIISILGFTLSVVCIVIHYES